MEFYPSQRPDFSAESPEAVAQWAEDQFLQLAELLQSPQDSVLLRQRASLPNKFGEGTLCNFGPGAESALANNWAGPGFYVFRQATSSWNKLEEN